MKLQLVHIPKTGGYAFFNFLYENYQDNFDLIGHEFSLHASDNPITIVRNPLNRFWSTYQFLKKGSEIFEFNNKFTIDEFICLAEKVHKINDEKFNLRDGESLLLPQSRWLGQDNYFKTTVVVYRKDLNISLLKLIEYLNLTNSTKSLERINATKDKKKMAFSRKELVKIMTLYAEDFALWREIKNSPGRFKQVIV